jgi:hypothetical protein
MENHTSTTAEPGLSRPEHVPAGEEFAQDALEERVLNRVSETVRPRAAEMSFQRLDGERRPTPPSAVSHAPLPFHLIPPLKSLTPGALRSGWTLFELVGEIRTFVRMFFDIRYRVSWFTWLVVVIGLTFALLSHWVVPFAYIPIVGPLLDKVVDLFLILFIYKILSLEARRYQEALAVYQQTYPR